MLRPTALYASCTMPLAASNNKNIELRNLAILILVLLSFTSCSKKNLAGYYSSNVAALGFFATRIQLNEDSTFKYEFSGDLAYNKGRGKYIMDNEGVVHLDFEPEPLADSVDLLTQALAGNEYRPMRFLFKNGKLYSFHLDGHVVKKGQGISSRRKYLFIGERYMTTRKIYLEKRRGKELIWRNEKNANR